MKTFKKNPDVKTVGDIFRNTMFVIPSFQRPYEWGMEACEELFEDIYEECFKHKNTGEDSYFVGSLVMYEYAKNGKDEDKIVGESSSATSRRKLEDGFRAKDCGLLKVVDGQQRLTSLLILLIALRDCERNAQGQANDEDLKSDLEELVAACKIRNDAKKRVELVRSRTNVDEDAPFKGHLQELYDNPSNIREIGRSRIFT